MAANCVGHLVTFRNRKFEAELVTNQELPIELLIEYLELDRPNAAIPYLLIGNEPLQYINAIYRVDGSHQEKISPKNLTPVWKQSDTYKATPEIWFDKRHEADELKKILENMVVNSTQTVEV